MIPVHEGHYNDVIMSTRASQITSLTIVYSTIYSGADQRIHESSASLAFVRGIYQGLVNSPQQMGSNRENVSIRWRHHGICQSLVSSTHKWLEVRNVDVIFDDNQYKLLNKHLGCWWFEIPWCLCDITVMNEMCHVFLSSKHALCSTFPNIIIWLDCIRSFTSNILDIQQMYQQIVGSLSSQKSLATHWFCKWNEYLSRWYLRYWCPVTINAIKMGLLNIYSNADITGSSIVKFLPHFIITPSSMKLKGAGVYWFHLALRPFVYLWLESISFSHILSTNFSRCVTCYLF